MGLQALKVHIYTSWMLLVLSLGDIDFFFIHDKSTNIYHDFQKYRDYVFSFTYDCFRADNHRYVPFYKRHNKLQIHFALCVCTSVLFLIS